MALQKAVTAATGAASPAAYHRLQEIVFRVLEGTGDATLYAYNSQADVGKSPVLTTFLAPRGVDLAAILSAPFSDAEKTSNPFDVLRARLYTYAKTRPEFGGAQDV